MELHSCESGDQIRSHRSAIRCRHESFAETTVGRLTTDRKPRLVITRNSDGEKVVNLDLVSTLVLVKGHYNSRWQDQEYLDRMDRFQLMFVLSDDLSWYTALGININGWTVVPPQDTPL